MVHSLTTTSTTPASSPLSQVAQNAAMQQQSQDFLDLPENLSEEDRKRIDFIQKRDLLKALRDFLDTQRGKLRSKEHRDVFSIAIAAKDPSKIMDTNSAFFLENSAVQTLVRTVTYAQGMNEAELSKEDRINLAKEAIWALRAIYRGEASAQELVDYLKESATQAIAFPLTDHEPAKLSDREVIFELIEMYEDLKKTVGRADTIGANSHKVDAFIQKRFSGKLEDVSRLTSEIRNGFPKAIGYLYGKNARQRPEQGARTVGESLEDAYNAWRDFSLLLRGHTSYGFYEYWQDYPTEFQNIVNALTPIVRTIQDAHPRVTLVEKGQTANHDILASDTRNSYVSSFLNQFEQEFFPSPQEQVGLKILKAVADWNWKEVKPELYIKGYSSLEKEKKEIADRIFLGLRGMAEGYKISAAKSGRNIESYLGTFIPHLNSSNKELVKNGINPMEIHPQEKTTNEKKSTAKSAETLRMERETKRIADEAGNLGLGAGRFIRKTLDWIGFTTPSESSKTDSYVSAQDTSAGEYAMQGAETRAGQRVAPVDQAKETVDENGYEGDDEKRTKPSTRKIVVTDTENLDNDKKKPKGMSGDL